MSDVHNEVKACIRFYERRKRDWLSAVEFILTKHSGILDQLLGRRDYILIPKNRVGRKKGGTQ